MAEPPTGSNNLHASPFSACLSFLTGTSSKYRSPSHDVGRVEANRKSLYALPDEILSLMFTYALRAHDDAHIPWLLNTPSIMSRHAVSRRWLRLALPPLFEAVTIASWHPQHTRKLHRWFANQCGPFSDLNPMIHTVVLVNEPPSKSVKASQTRVIACIEHNQLLKSLPNLKQIICERSAHLTLPPPPYFPMTLETLRLGGITIGTALRWLAFVSTKTLECWIMPPITNEEPVNPNRLSPVQKSSIKTAHLGRSTGVAQAAFDVLLDGMLNLEVLELGGVQLGETISSRVFPCRMKRLTLTTLFDNPLSGHAPGLLSLARFPDGQLFYLTTLIISSTSIQAFPLRVEALLRVAPNLQVLLVSGSVDLTLLISSFQVLPLCKNHCFETFDLLVPSSLSYNSHCHFNVHVTNFFNLKEAICLYNLKLQSISGEPWSGMSVLSQLEKLTFSENEFPLRGTYYIQAGRAVLKEASLMHSLMR